MKCVCFVLFCILFCFVYGKTKYTRNICSFGFKNCQKGGPLSGLRAHSRDFHLSLYNQPNLFRASASAYYTLSDVYKTKFFYSIIVGSFRILRRHCKITVNKPWWRNQLPTLNGKMDQNLELFLRKSNEIQTCK